VPGTMPRPTGSTPATSLSDVFYNGDMTNLSTTTGTVTAVKRNWPRTTRFQSRWPIIPSPLRVLRHRPFDWPARCRKGSGALTAVALPGAAFSAITLNSETLVYALSNGWSTRLVCRSPAAARSSRGGHQHPGSGGRQFHPPSRAASSSPMVFCNMPVPGGLGLYTPRRSMPPNGGTLDLHGVSCLAEERQHFPATVYNGRGALVEHPQPRGSLTRAFHNLTLLGRRLRYGGPTRFDILWRPPGGHV